MTELARSDERIREEDLKKLLDSQLGTVSQLWLFLAGVLFGGILTAIVTRGIDWVSSFNPFNQAIEWLVVSTLAAVLLGVLTVLIFSVIAQFIMRRKINLMKDYVCARQILEGRRESWTGSSVQ